MTLERGSVELTNLCTLGLHALKQHAMLLLYSLYLVFTALLEVGLIIIFLIFRDEQAKDQQI